MSRRYGRVRCRRCGTRYGLDESHTCLSNAAVMAAAFGGPGRVAGSNDVPCWDEACEHRAWGQPDGGIPVIDEDFEREVQRVMWEQNVGDRTARHVVQAERRLAARKADLRAARAVA